MPSKISLFINRMNIYIFILLVIYLLFPISLNPIDTTFNFADNLWYAKSIELLKISFSQGTPFYLSKDTVFIWEDYKIFLATPLWQMVGLGFSYIIAPHIFINLLIIVSLFLNLQLSYKLNLFLSKNNYVLSFLGAIIFWASSLVLYSNWFNLMGLFFIPLTILSLLKYIKTSKVSSLIKYTLYLLLLCLSSTYFIPIITLLILVFLIFNLQNNYKKRFLIIFLSAMVVWISFITYKVPFKYLESYWKPIEIEKLLNERKISSSVDAMHLIIPNNKNIFSNWQLEQVKNIANLSVPYFRYSTYLPIPLIILLILWIIKLYVWKEKLWKHWKVWLIIIILSFILFLWDRIKINWLDLWINNILHYIKQLPNWEVLRKSAYFFFPLTFGISVMLIWILWQNYKKKYDFMFLILSCFILLMNFSPYHWKHFKVHWKSNIVNELPKNSKILSLPNTWYNNWELSYFLFRHSNKLKFYEYWNATLPWYKNLKMSKQNSFIRKLAYNEKIESKQNCDLDWDIDYIILHQEYIENFFFFSNKTAKYIRAKNNIKQCTNFREFSRDNNVTIYKVLKRK